ncbi:MAG TPA: sulfotransferase, partial [Arenimonas sp.]|nr:sulfotransferase [Arenimonas sp.]
PMKFDFLMCSERSGSNLITRMLDSHPAICGPPARHLFNPVARNLFRYGDLRQSDNWSALLKDFADLLESGLSLWRTRVEEAELAQLAATGDVTGLLRGVFEAEARASGKQRIFVKENQIYEFILFLELGLPGAHYLYLVRDPRDMALSWKKSATHAGGVVRAARQWQRDQIEFLKCFRELSLRGRAMLIHYEALIADPETALRRICTQFGLPFANSMLSYHADELTRQNALHHPAWSNLDKAVMHENRAKYLSELSPAEIRAVEHICAREMRLLGYAPEGDHSDSGGMSEQELVELEQYESQHMPHSPSEGVKRNIEAKQAFYRKG